MNFHAEILPGEPILTIRFAEEFSLADEGIAMSEHVKGMLDNLTQPVTLVIDDFPFKVSFEQMIYIANMVTKMTGLLGHPNVRRAVGVSTERSAQVAAAGLRSPIFGGIDVVMCPTFEAALAEARSR